MKGLKFLFLSIVLSFWVMTYTNSLIGGMGGIPVFVGFFVLFYSLRGKVEAGRSSTVSSIPTAKKERKKDLRDYVMGFVAVWLFMKVLEIFARITGWARIDGMTIAKYLQQLFSSTPIEYWAYFISGVIMAAYILSLFPLITIQRKKSWLIYFLADHVIFSVLCGLIAFLCRFHITERKRRWGTCVFDDLLLCKMPGFWTRVLCIFAGVLLLCVVLVCVFRIAEYFDCHRLGKQENKEKAKKKKSRKEYQIILVVAGVIICSLSAGIGYFFFRSNKGNTEYEKVASCLTKDSVLGPMQYKDSIYIPVEADWDLTTRGKVLGYLGYKEQDCDSRFYELVIANFLYYEKIMGENYLQMDGADVGHFEEVSFLEEKKEWEKDKVFLLWDEDWLSQSRYSKISGYTVASEALILALKEQYPKVSYHPNDFQDYDAYFTIRSYPEMEVEYDAKKEAGHWCGCILVKDNQFYYGSYENPIEGVTLQMLLDTLGGYGKNQQQTSGTEMEK